MKKTMASTVALVIFLSFAIFGSGCTASAGDATTTKAYDLILKASDSFKDPSSVRVMGGDFYIDDKDNETLCVVLSANNSYGARGNGYYIVYSDGYASNIEEDSVAFILENQGEAIPNGTDDGQRELYEQCLAMLSKDGFDYDKVNEKLVDHWKNF